MRRIFLLLVVAALFFAATSADAQTIQVSPSNMTFAGVQPVGSPFPGVLQVQIANTSSVPVNFSSATVTGDFFFGPDPFTQSVSFGSLIPGGTLSFALYFKAAAAGPRTGTLTLVDSATGSPQIFTLSGIGFVGAMVQPDSANLDIVVFTLGAPITNSMQITSVGNQAATVTDVSITGAGFSQSNTCGAVMTQGQKCQVNVTFNPTVAGVAKGTLAVTNTGITNPIVIALIGDAEDFSMDIAPTASSVTINAGQQAIYPFLVGLPPGQNLSAISFNCTGLPPGAACAVMAGNLALPGPLSAQLVISTTGNGSASLHSFPGQVWPVTAAMLFAFVAGRRRRRGSLLVMFAFAALLATFAGCGSSRSPGSTPAGTFSVIVTGMRNGLTHSFPVTLTVR